MIRQIRLNLPLLLLLTLMLLPPRYSRADAPPAFSESAALQKMTDEIKKSSDDLQKSAEVMNKWQQEMQEADRYLEHCRDVAKNGPPSERKLCVTSMASALGQTQLNWNIRDGAARLLSTLAPEAKEAVPAILKGLEDPIGAVRLSSALTLAKLTPYAVEQLKPYLAHARADVRAHAVYALQKNNSPAALAALAEALKDSSDETALNAAVVLRDIPSSKAKELFSSYKTSSSPKYLAALASSKPAEKDLSIRAAGILLIPESIPVLIGMLNDSDNGRKLHSEMSLAALQPQSISPLIAALDGTDEKVQAGAASTLAMIGPKAKAAVPTLTRVLKSSHNLGTQISVSTALQRIGTPEALDALKNNPIKPSF